MVSKNRVLAGALCCVVLLVLLVVFFDSEWIGSVLNRNSIDEIESQPNDPECKITPLREVKKVLNLYGNEESSPLPSMTREDCEGSKSRRFINEDNPLSRSSRWLLSFPGSGNTWCRLMLEQLTGIHTGMCSFAVR